MDEVGSSKRRMPSYAMIPITGAALDRDQESWKPSRNWYSWRSSECLPEKVKSRVAEPVHRKGGGATATTRNSESKG